MYLHLLSFCFSCISPRSRAARSKLNLITSSRPHLTERLESSIKTGKEHPLAQSSTLIYIFTHQDNIYLFIVSSLALLITLAPFITIGPIVETDCDSDSARTLYVVQCFTLFRVWRFFSFSSRTARLSARVYQTIHRHTHFS